MKGRGRKEKKSTKFSERFFSLRRSVQPVERFEGLGLGFPWVGCGVGFFKVEVKKEGFRGNRVDSRLWELVGISIRISRRILLQVPPECATDSLALLGALLIPLCSGASTEHFPGASTFW